MAFHSAIYAASGNPLIVDYARLHWMLLRRVMGAVHQVVGPAQDGVGRARRDRRGDRGQATRELAARLSVQHTRIRAREPGAPT